MRKGLAFWSAGVSFVGLCVVAVACGDDGGANVFPGAGEDASFDTGPGFIREGGEPDSGPVTCNPAKPTQFKATWVAPTANTGPCTTDDIGDYYNNCLPDFDKPKCSTWLAAHQACGSCIQKDDNSGAVQVFTQPAVFYRLNQGGCFALVQKKTGDDQCGAAFEAATECRRVSCDDCLAKGGAFGNANECSNEGTPLSYICCQMRAGRTGCEEFQTAQSQKCPAKLSDVDGGAPDCFSKSATESEHDLYVRAIGIFCGPT
jgi:hypothetical protein